MQLILPIYGDFYQDALGSVSVNWIELIAAIKDNMLLSHYAPCDWPKDYFSTKTYELIRSKIAIDI
ncbi:hypothetical protein [Sinimarinibacterium sp. NLF-5-8]|uniref:hypothetical protein n=1 Tax=Sinimarinibacterium sp. NLF-5-8 TaxID=2698684 RepID=UPI00137BB03E|nr:hypothetical protein [Sinimarinibacterium sp. NLF-5-8]QHS09407.1 hypothetical protein GT972_04030 [Sinimarinibacterium sp. NLF-5-8]